MKYLLRNISTECYNWINSQNQVKEESLTDWMLYELSKHDSRIIYKEFTRHKESFNGADWEWWIIEPHPYIPDEIIAFRFFVQAKKIQHNNCFKTIEYENKNGMQLDLLISSAKAHNALPIYMFYSTVRPETKQQKLNFPCRPIKDRIDLCSKHNDGAYIALAHNVQGLIRKNMSSKYISSVELLNFALDLSIFDILFSKSQSTRLKYLKIIGDISNSIFNEKKEANIQNQDPIQYLVKLSYDISDLFNQSGQKDSKNISVRKNSLAFKCSKANICFDTNTIPSYVKRHLDQISRDDLIDGKYEIYALEHPDIPENIKGSVFIDLR